ncbi:hypothetical protein K439DRAFT_1623656 [Ramaria rubella]|nr:hypothetical protein K439DRAFT_1623656 [Ramaria rubella]
MDFLWVQWLGRDPAHRSGWKACHLDRIGFVPHEEPEAFRFLDPALVCHHAPVLTQPLTPAIQGGGVGHLAQPQASCSDMHGLEPFTGLTDEGDSEEEIMHMAPETHTEGPNLPLRLDTTDHEAPPADDSDVSSMMSEPLDSANPSDLSGSDHEGSDSSVTMNDLRDAKAMDSEVDEDSEWDDFQY